MKKRQKLAWLALAVCAAAVMSRAQTAGNAASQALELSEATQAGGNLGFEPVGPGDLVSVSVTGAPELSRSSRVTTDGQLILPLLHEGVSVNGLKPAAIGQAISAALMKEKILVEPIVSVAVLEYRSRHE